MSQTLIDRISRAVYAKGLEPPSREVLIAVIEAMREPTPEMCEAGFQHTGDPCWPENVGKAWSAMIDETLK